MLYSLFGGVDLKQCPVINNLISQFALDFVVILNFNLQHLGYKPQIYRGDINLKLSCLIGFDNGLFWEYLNANDFVKGNFGR